MGSYFGSSLCAVDLNSDGLSDLLVGAPMFSEIRDEGQVTVYINRGNVSIYRRWLVKGWGRGSGHGNANVFPALLVETPMSQIVGLQMSLAGHEVTENSSGIMVSQTPAHIHHRAMNLLRRSGKVPGFMLKLGGLWFYINLMPKPSKSQQLWLSFLCILGGHKDLQVSGDLGDLVKRNQKLNSCYLYVVPHIQT